MNEKTFIKNILEENIIELNAKKSDELYTEKFMHRFVKDELIANIFIINSKISRNTYDWAKADKYYLAAKKWKDTTVYDVDFKLVKDEAEDYIKIEKIKNKYIFSILKKISSCVELLNIIYSNDILVEFEGIRYIYNVHKSILIKIAEIKNKDMTIYLLSVPWRLMILYGEIGLRKSYFEAGQIIFILNNLLGSKIKESKDLIFFEEEEKIGFTNVEKKIINRWKLKNEK